MENLGLNYTWTVQQIECATDILFKQPGDLEPFYEEIVRTAIFTVKPDNIATFLGQRITYNGKKEVGTNYNQRILGTRIKHHMGDVSIKMYDKFGHVLRIESTCNDIGTSRVKRKVEHRGLNFFAERDLWVLEAISRGEYMTYGMQGKDIRQYLGDISFSAMSRIFKRLRLHGIIEGAKGTDKYFPTAYGKEVIAAGLAVRNLVLIPALA